MYSFGDTSIHLFFMSFSKKKKKKANQYETSMLNESDDFAVISIPLGNAVSPTTNILRSLPGAPPGNSMASASFFF